jgi:hypothetical protein
MEGSGAEPYDAARAAREAQKPDLAPPGTISGLPNTPSQ